MFRIAPRVVSCFSDLPPVAVEGLPRRHIPGRPRPTTGTWSQFQAARDMSKSSRKRWRGSLRSAPKSPFTSSGMTAPPSIRPPLVLQRRLPGPTSHAPPPPLGAPSLAVAGGRPTIAFPTPMGPPQDLVDVPLAYLQQVDQKGTHLGNSHLRLFFPPLVLSVVPGIPRPAVRGPYGGANQPSLVSRTRPGRIVPWPT